MRTGRMGGGTERFKAAMLSILLITSLAAFLLVAATPKPLEASPDCTPVDLAPTDDTYVCEKYPTDLNGSNSMLYIGWDESYLAERIYFQFDLSSVPAGATIDSADLYVYTYYGFSTGDPPYPGRETWVDVKEVNNDGWDESTLNWINAPPMGDVIDRQYCTGYGAWYSWGVTSYVASEHGGDRIVSLGLMSESEGSDISAWFTSTDSTYPQHPYLRVCYSTPPVEMLISPESQSGPPGETLSFTVEVTNNTGEAETFDLTVENEWEVGIPPTIGPISNGGSANVTMTVTAPNCFGPEDEITVTAASQKNPEINVAKKCTASVPPFYPTYDTYVGNLCSYCSYPNSSYIYAGTILESGDPNDCRAYWQFDLSSVPAGATIDNAYFSVYTCFGGQNGGWSGSSPAFGDATLTVDVKEVSDDDWNEDTICWDTKPPMGATLDSAEVPPTNNLRYTFDVTSFVRGESDRVVSIGMVSQSEGVNELAAWVDQKDTDYWPGRESYISLCYTLGSDVDVTIEDPTQSGLPGDTLSYTVRVTNTGPDQDTFDLENSDTWVMSLSKDSTNPLAPGAHENVILQVTIPSDAENGASTTVTVKATSRADPNVDDSDTCTATAEVSTPPPGQPQLSSPANATITNDNTPTFEWTCGENADNHRLLIDNDNDFSSPRENRLFGATDNEYTIPGENSLPDDNYSWKVVAINAGGENESSARTFVIDTVPLGQPQLHLPADGALTNDNTPAFEWVPGANADSHRLLVDNNNDFSSPAENRLLGATDNTYTPADENSLPDDDYSWKVIGIRGKNENASTVWTFLVDTVSPGVPAKSTPADGILITDNTPTFSWVAATDELSGVAFYEIWVDDDPDFSSPEVLDNTADNTATTHTSPVLVDDSYSWRVRAWDRAGNAGNFEASWTLSITVGGVEVSTLPGENEAAPGEDVTFTVTVTNECNITDNYDLTVTDDAGWAATLNDYLLEDVAPDESRQTTVSVTVPSGAIEGQTTGITVRATSQAGSTVWAESSCVAQAGPPPPSEFPWLPVVVVVVVIGAIVVVILAFVRPFYTRKDWASGSYWACGSLTRSLRQSRRRSKSERAIPLQFYIPRFLP